MKRLLLILSVVLMTAAAKAQSRDGSLLDISAQTPVLKSYPNPATTVITFDFQRNFEKGYSIQIYSFLGRKMIERQLVADQTTVNLTDFTRGVYIYKLFDRNGRLVETGKFSVSK